MLSFLFWNLGKRPLAPRIVRLARAHRLDVVMLAESMIDPSDLVASLNEAGDRDYLFARTDGSKLQVYVRTTVGNVAEQYLDQPGNLTIRRLDLPAAPSILVAVVHMPSKATWDSDSQAGHAGELAREIRTAEQDVGHDRTIVVGDLNMNPYEPGVCGAHGFNAVLTKQKAFAGGRTVQGREFPFFYNPMWAQFGDRTPGPPGTFYHRSAPPDSHFWHVYDQLLLRPCLMDKLELVEAATSDGVESLVTEDGLPDGRVGSDHLPLLFRLSI